MAKGSKGSEAAHAPLLVPPWTGQCCHCLLGAHVRVPSHFGTRTHTPWEQGCFGPRACSSQVPWLAVVVDVRVSLKVK